MILHITNDYSGSTVYKNLVGELDKLGLAQIVYNPIKEKSRIGKNKIDLTVPDSKIIYAHILNKTTDRIFYRKKIKKIVKDIESKIDLKKVDFIHAHTWYSDGGVAYLLSKKYNIPFMVAVRSTDLDIFYKYLYFDRKFGIEILKSAESIILISQAFKDRLIGILDLETSKNLNNISTKLKIVPNGIDQFWLDNPTPKKLSISTDRFNLIYVGTFIKRKKLEQVQQAIIKLNNKSPKYHLHIIGGKGENEKKILELINEFPQYFSYYGYISDREELLKLYKQADVFIMPSKRETFGLVYLEALTQGLPIIYVKNEGIDGFYENVGETVDPDNIESICKGIMKIENNYEKYNFDLSTILINHNWVLIACKYQQIYQKWLG